MLWHLTLDRPSILLKPYYEQLPMGSLEIQYFPFHRNNINLPIVEIVNDVLNHNLKATEAITILMNRKLKEESL